MPITWLQPNERACLGVLSGQPRDTRGSMTLEELRLVEKERWRWEYCIIMQGTRRYVKLLTSLFENFFGVFFKMII